MVPRYTRVWAMEKITSEKQACFTRVNSFSNAGWDGAWDGAWRADKVLQKFR